jgi:hypothetical protein
MVFITIYQAVQKPPKNISAKKYPDKYNSELFHTLCISKNDYIML